MIAYLVRFAAIVAGYLVASLAASVFVYALMLARQPYEPAGPPLTPTGHLLLLLVGTAFAARLHLVPAALVILIGEMLGRRDWLFYALGGAVIGFVMVALMPDAAYVEAAFRLEMTGAGVVGGFFYWLTAGRWTLSWRRDPLADTES